MSVRIADFFHFGMSDHNEECDTIGDFPLVLISYFRICFSGLDIDFEGEKRFFLPSFHILEESDAEFVAFSAMNGCLNDEGSWKCGEYLDPIWMFSIDDKLSFYLTSHDEKLSIAIVLESFEKSKYRIFSCFFPFFCIIHEILSLYGSFFGYFFLIFHEIL